MGSRSSNRYVYFVFDKAAGGAPARSLSDNLEVRVFIPSWRRIAPAGGTSTWLYLFWFFFSKKRFKIYYVIDGSRVIHMSHLVSRNFRFPFLGPNDLEIGPCWTDPAYRGMGVYPFVLARIAGDWADKVDRLFVMSDVGNISSLKGIVKSGFRPFGEGGKFGILGIYRIDKYESDR